MIFKRQKAEPSAGAAAENRAKHYLIQQGLRHLQSNYHCRFGEIDLIMQDGDSFVFVEVRMRNNRKFGSAAETITLPKQKKITITAQEYMSKTGNLERFPMRFDVVAIEQENIQWIKGAF